MGISAKPEAAAGALLPAGLNEILHRRRTGNPERRITAGIVGRMVSDHEFVLFHRSQRRTDIL